jgi:hypothetical protein
MDLNNNSSSAPASCTKDFSILDAQEHQHLAIPSNLNHETTKGVISKHAPGFDLIAPLGEFGTSLSIMTTYSNTFIACTLTLTHLKANKDEGPRTNLKQIEP